MAWLTRKEAIIKGEDLTPMSRAEAMLKKEDIPVFTRKEALTKELINGGSGSFETMGIILENNSGIPFPVMFVSVVYNNGIGPIPYTVGNGNDYLFSSVVKGSYIAFVEPVEPEYVTFYKYRYDEATDEDIYTEIEDTSQFDLKIQNGKIIGFKAVGNYGEDEYLIVRITGR